MSLKRLPGNRPRSSKSVIAAILGLLLSLTIAGSALAVTVAAGLLYATGLTSPAAEIWLPGSLGGHLWVSDRAQGFCRLDPVPGLTSTLINPATCAMPGNIASGQAAYDPVTRSTYLTDASVASQGVFRLQYDPATETVANPAPVAAGLIAADDGPQSAAVGPDGKLYLGLIKKGRIVRIAGLNAGSQTVEPVGATSNGLPAVSLGFVSSDLYVAEAVNVTRLANAPQCAGSCVAALANIAVLGPRGFAFDAGSANLYVADITHVFRYNVGSKVLDVYADAGIDANNVAVLLKDIHSLGINPQGQVLVGENANAGSLAGQVWLLLPNLVPVFDPEPGDPLRPIASLKTVPVPQPSNLGDFVADKTSAIQLGKALFWDMQVGSDGVQACASCHFQAGADVRAKNQIDPGVRGGDSTFQLNTPNYVLQPGDFPLTKHVDPNLPSAVSSDTNDIISSQGVMLHDFVGVVHKLPYDNCSYVADSVFNVGGINVRRVEPRNSPSVVNAVFNNRNFWDGRANNVFNGVNPFGSRDPNAKVWRTTNNATAQITVAIPNSSLASQAVGPPGSFFEMSCDARAFPDIGHKLLGSAIVPLGKQWVDSKDSVLGPLSGMRLSKPAMGLTVPYINLVKKAFRSEYWQASKVGDGTYTQMEANFSLFFGLAIQMYEATLVSDNTPFDQFMAGNGAALTTNQQIGLSVFVGPGRCVACHAGPELTKASVGSTSVQHLERMVMGNGACAVYDNGFYNIGVRPTGEDIGLGGQDPFGNPLSETGLAMLAKFADPNLSPPFGSSGIGCDTRANVDGTFKTPSLRNVELNGPYFHNGGQATLREVVDFYNRGGDFGAANIATFDPNIQFLGLTEDQKSALVDFLTALTDERVRWEKAPFDHPAICIPNGQVGDTTSVTPAVTGGKEAADVMLCLPAVGAGGNTAPLKPFLNLSPFAH